MSTSAGLALGSNIGDRLAHLKRARDRLRLLSSPPDQLLQAPIYQTAPVACPDGSPDFYNTVVEIQFEGSARQLLDAALALELELGRDRSAGPNAPRIIDIDLLYLGDESITETGLDLPHPRLTARRFVLQPLADIRPGLVLPGDSATIDEHLARIGSSEADLALVQAVW
jgi:2-amino-4-hydroxy-6-hydroxymethyldihydropteridine diphosphokinase